MISSKRKSKNKLSSKADGSPKQNNVEFVESKVKKLELEKNNAECLLPVEVSQTSKCKVTLQPEGLNSDQECSEAAISPLSKQKLCNAKVKCSPFGIISKGKPKTSLKRPKQKVETDEVISSKRLKLQLNNKRKSKLYESNKSLQQSGTFKGKLLSTCGSSKPNRKETSSSSPSINSAEGKFLSTCGSSKPNSKETSSCNTPINSAEVDLYICDIKQESGDFTWKDEEYLADSEQLQITTAGNIIKLFDDGNTIPFIARYRSNLTGGLEPDKLRKIKATYDHIRQIRRKGEQLIKEISKQAALTPSLRRRIQEARSLEELELISAPFKKDNSRSLAERAKLLGLDKPAESILEGSHEVNLASFVDPLTEGLKNVEKVREGIKHVIADVISKDSEVHLLLDKIKTSEKVILQSTSKCAKDEESRGESKYELYSNFSQSVGQIKPYQILAINRGEAEKELSVKIVIPNYLWRSVENYCKRKWLSRGKSYKLRTTLLVDSLDDAIKRLLGPFVVRHVRARLKEAAEDEAVNVFGSNLRQLLMTPPCRGKTIMGIDPGFTHGCKMAVVSEKGDLLGFDKFFLTKKNSNEDLCLRKIVTLVLKFNCETIALGNGVGCRETEALLTKLIRNNAFKPLKVSYTIVNEQGISIYSCSVEATEEFRNLDPTFVSAASLARRLQDPLNELVKVEPKHLGVGMYQHDVREKKLVSALDEIVSECVSFVGVDINSASFYLLKRVAGLNASQAQEIIKYRSANCPFRTREDLQKVKGIKTKTFQQCAGFIRIIPATAESKCHRRNCCKRELNPLDETCIHPESYESVVKLLKILGRKLDELGSQEFIKTVQNLTKIKSAEDLAEDCGASAFTMQFIIKTLMKPKQFDERSLSAGPIFRQDIKGLEELTPGEKLTGVVRNVVPFGAFVDIGVGKDGLVHISQMKNSKLQINDQVAVEVNNINEVQGKIQLKLLSVITKNF